MAIDCKKGKKTLINAAFFIDWKITETKYLLSKTCNIKSRINLKSHNFLFHLLFRKHGSTSAGTSAKQFILTQKLNCSIFIPTPVLGRNEKLLNCEKKNRWKIKRECGKVAKRKFLIIHFFIYIYLSHFIIRCVFSM